MTTEDIKQMFLDAAALQKMGPFDEAKAETEKRFAKLRAAYVAELLDSDDAEPTEPPPPAQPDWQGALKYLITLLQQVERMDPSTGPTNKAALEIVVPAVQQFYSRGKNPGECR